MRVRVGFTIIELLVAILIVAVLLTLAVGTVRHSREVARRTNVLAEMRQHAVVFTGYSSDFSDFAPSFTRPSQLTTIECCGWVIQQIRYFDAFHSWNIALADRYPSNDMQDDVFFLRTRRPNEQRLWTDYYYSSAFLTDYAFWRPTLRTGPEQWKPQRLSDVLQPSRKGLLIAFDRNDDLESVQAGFTGFTDGSAQRYRLSDLTQPYIFAAGPWSETDGLRAGWPVVHTLDGVRGVDVTSR